MARYQLDRTVPLGNDVEPGYQERCEKAVHEFAGWLGDRGWGSLDEFKELPLREVGDIVTQYVSHLFEQDEVRGLAEHTVLGLGRRFWWLKPAMSPSWKLLQDTKHLEKRAK